MTCTLTDQSSCPRWNRHDTIALILTLLGLLWALWMGWASTGFYQDDDITHLNMARWGWQGNVLYLWHSWGRPGFTVPAALAWGLGGTLGVRWMSALMTVVAVWCAYRIARRMGSLPLAGGKAWWVLVPMLIWLQPMLMRLALTCLTETPALMCLSVAVWLLLRGNLIWASIALSPAFLARYELVSILPIWGLLVYAQYARMRSVGWKTLWWRVRPLVACLLTVWAITLYAGVDWWYQMPLGYSPRTMFIRQYTGEYGWGPWWWFALRWVAEGAGGGIAVLALAGMFVLVYTWYQEIRTALPGARGQALRTLWTNEGYWRGGVCLVLVVWLIFLHSFLYNNGMFESGGYARFLVPNGGFTAILAAWGLACLWQGSVAALWGGGLMLAMALGLAAQKESAIVGITALGFVICAAVWASVQGRWLRYIGVGLVVFLGIATVIQGRALIRPLDTTPDGEYIERVLGLRPGTIPVDTGQRIAETAAFIARAQHLETRPAWTGHVAIPCFFPSATCVGSFKEALDRWEQATPGTLYFWENKYGLPWQGKGRDERLIKALEATGRVVIGPIVDRDSTIIVYEKVLPATTAPQ